VRVGWLGGWVGGWVVSRSYVLCKRQQAPASAGKGQAAVQVGYSEVQHECQQGDSRESMCASSGHDVGVGQMRKGQQWACASPKGVAGGVRALK
jgi:hypothetical protein